MMFSRNSLCFLNNIYWFRFSHHFYDLFNPKHYPEIPAQIVCLKEPKCDCPSLSQMTRWTQMVLIGRPHLKEDTLGTLAIFPLDYSHMDIFISPDICLVFTQSANSLNYF